MKYKKTGIVVALVIVAGIAYTLYLNRSEPTELSGQDSTLMTESEEQSEEASLPESNNTVVASDQKSAPPKPQVSTTLIDHKAPFTAQAPKGGWDDERQQDGCEEASALMAVYWAQGKKLNSSIALSHILGASDYEQNTHGEFRDISVQDTVQWIFKEYFKYDKVRIMKSVTIESLAAELSKGNVIVAPLNGQKLGNPYFSPPGPERHMLLIRGYDPKKKQFITNDPGTKRGESYRYNEKILFDAILSYPTGHHEPIGKVLKEVIIVSK